MGVAGWQTPSVLGIGPCGAGQAGASWAAEGLEEGLWVSGACMRPWAPGGQRARAREEGYGVGQ